MCGGYGRKDWFRISVELVSVSFLSSASSMVVNDDLEARNMKTCSSLRPGEGEYETNFIFLYQYFLFYY